MHPGSALEFRSRAFFLFLEQYRVGAKALPIGVNLSPKAEALGYPNEVRLRGLSLKPAKAGFVCVAPGLQPAGIDGKLFPRLGFTLS